MRAPVCGLCCNSFLSDCSRARIALALFVLVALTFVAVTLSPLRSGFADGPNRGPGDVQLYRAEVDRIAAGANYYDAIATELRTRGYPTRSLFNWRMPLPVWLIGSLPSIEVARGVLGGLCIALLLASFCWLAQDAGPRQGLLGVVLLVGALLPCAVGDLLVMPELWSGVLLALSAVLLGLDRRTAGVVAGVAALFVRELAAPYILVCLGRALYERRWRELAGWAAGLACYAIYLAWHASQVLPRITPDDLAHTSGWLRFGGAGFLISTVQMNGYLLLLPQWVTGIYLACVLTGATAGNSAGARRIGLTVAAYAIAFSLAGHDFNQYWGSMIAPLFCLAACRSPQMIHNWVVRSAAARTNMLNSNWRPAT